jgi:hypothetical protein
VFPALAQNEERGIELFECGSEVGHDRLLSRCHRIMVLRASTERL